MADSSKQVTFESAVGSYPTGADVVCRFTVSPEFAPQSRDWVGLFKVGWSKLTDVHYYLWVALPLEVREDGVQHGTITFPANNMPKDDGEYYLFVYVDHKGSMRASSMPFRFKMPSCDDLVEEEWEDSDMLVITTKQMQLEAQVSDLEAELKRLRQKNQTVDRDRDSLIARLADSDAKLKQEQAVKDKLAACYEESDAKCTDMRREIDELSKQMSESMKTAEKLNQLMEEKEEKNRRAEQAVMDLTEEVKQLKNVKDQLEGQLEGSRIEKNQYSQLIVEHDKYKHRYEQEIAELREQLMKKQYTTEDLDVLQVELISAKESLEISEKKEKDCKEKIAVLELQHQQDEERIQALNDTLADMSRRLETVTAHNEEMRAKHNRSLFDLEQLNGERQDWMKQFEEYDKEKNGLMSTICSLKSRVEALEKEHGNNAMDEDRYYALQMAFDMAKQELRDMEKELASKKKREAKLHEQDRKNKAKIDELQERLRQGESEWKSLAKEKADVEKKLVQVQRAGNTGSGWQTYLAGSNQLTREELQQLSEQQHRDLEEMRTKKDRYKAKYLDEKQRCVTLKDYYTEELAKKDGELALCRCAIQSQVENGGPLKSSSKKLSKACSADFSSQQHGTSTHKGAIPKRTHTASGVAPIVYPHVRSPSTPTSPLELKAGAKSFVGDPEPIVYPDVKSPTASMSCLKSSSHNLRMSHPGVTLCGKHMAFLDLGLPLLSTGSQTKLPPPIIPSRRISADGGKVGGDDDDDDQELDLTIQYVDKPRPAEVKKTNDKEPDSDDDNEGADKFHDATELPLTEISPLESCCICHNKFGNDESPEDIAIHVNEHLLSNDCTADHLPSVQDDSNYICCICNKKFDKMRYSEEYVSAHVHRHLDQNA